MLAEILKQTGDVGVTTESDAVKYGKPENDRKTGVN